MNKKGFTLIELLAVIIILALLVSIIGISVTGMLRRSKEKLYTDVELESIKKSAEMWGAYNMTKLPELDGECRYITLSTLQNADLLNESIKDGESLRKEILGLVEKAKISDVEEEDFISAELEIVPAGPARDLGLDRSMIIGYGHDDRVCAYTSLRAILDSKTCKRTICAYLVDKEEVGSIGATGAQSQWYQDILAEMISKQGNYSDLLLRRAMTNTRMLSSDVSAGYDPLYASVFEAKNAAYLGNGITFNKYTGARGKSGCNDTSAEFVRDVRKVMDENNINYQTAELGRIDVGGGGTIAYIMGNQNMSVMDAGVPVLSMHAPCEVVSKVDVYEAYLAYKAFVKDIK